MTPSPLQLIDTVPNRSCGDARLLGHHRGGDVSCVAGEVVEDALVDFVQSVDHTVFSFTTPVTSSPPYSRFRRSLRVGLPTKSVFAGLGTSGLYPVVIQGVPRPRYPYPRWIREYLSCFLTVSTAGEPTEIPSNDRVELPIQSHYIGRMDRLGCITDGLYLGESTDDGAVSPPCSLPAVAR